MQEKEDKKGFLQSFTGKFKKISLDDEPDELMLKYGDIKLKGPGGGEGQSGIHAARTSFFFSENRDEPSPKAGDRPEIGMTQELSLIHIFRQFSWVSLRPITPMLPPTAMTALSTPASR